MSTEFYYQKKGGIHRGDFGPKSMTKKRRLDRVGCGGINGRR